MIGATTKMTTDMRQMSTFATRAPMHKNTTCGPVCGIVRDLPSGQRREKLVITARVAADLGGSLIVGPVIGATAGMFDLRVLCRGTGGWPDDRIL
jgi:hypothetical protein